MEATLRFDLEDNEDKMAHLRATKSLELALVIWDIDQWLRNQVKYGKKDVLVFEGVRNQLHEIMNDNGIILDDLIE